MSITIALLFACVATSMAQYYNPYAAARPNPYQNTIVSAQAQDQVGNFGYATADGQSRTQTVAADGSVRGSYSYTDANGKPVRVQYIADQHGYRALGDNIPVHAQHIPAPEVVPSSPAFVSQPYGAPAVAAPQYGAPVAATPYQYNPAAEQQLANTILQHYASDQLAQTQQLQQLEAIKRSQIYG